MSMRRQTGEIEHVWFMFVSRFLFRTCEVSCNHLVRMLDGGGLSLEPFSSQLALLESRRRRLQRVMRKIGSSHDSVCADCKGKCCGGVRERDAYIDRILQDPATPNRNARRLTGELVELTDTQRAAFAEAVWAEGYCRELTNMGCRIPCDQRPIQCAAYFCQAAVRELSQREGRLANGTNIGLMRVQLKTVGLALKARFAR